MNEGTGKTANNTYGPRVALYERVSTMAQAEQGYSLDGQLHELRERMESEGRRIVAEVADPGEKRWIHVRPGLDKIKSLAAEGEIDEVWAWAWDRYGQSPVPEVLAIELAEYSVTLRSLDDGGEGLGGEILRAVGGVLSREDQRKRVEKSLMGKRSKARKGEVLGAAFRPRYGFQYARNEFGRPVGYAVDEDKMAVVINIFEMLADGASIHEVRRKLEGHVSAPGGGKMWSRTTIKSIVFDDVYLPRGYDEVEPLVSEEIAARLDRDAEYGIWYYGRNRTRRKSHRSKVRIVEKNPPEKWTAVPVDLSGSRLRRKVVERARQMLRDRPVREPATVSRFNELSGGIFYCGGCGRAMVPDRRRRKTGADYHYYYRCETKHSRGTDACPLPKSYRAEEVEVEVWDYISALVTMPERLNAAFEREIERLRVANRDPGREMEAVTKRLTELVEERARAQELAVRGLLDPDDLAAQLGRIAEDKAALEERLEACRGRNEHIAALEAYRDALFMSYLFGGPGMHDPLQWPPEKRHALYKQLGLRVMADPEGGIQMEWSLMEDADMWGVTDTTS